MEVLHHFFDKGTLSMTGANREIEVIFEVLTIWTKSRLCRVVYLEALDVASVASGGQGFKGYI